MTSILSGSRSGARRPGPQRKLAGLPSFFGLLGRLVGALGQRGVASSLFLQLAALVSTERFLAVLANLTAVSFRKWHFRAGWRCENFG